MHDGMSLKNLGPVFAHPEKQIKGISIGQNSSKNHELHRVKV